MAKKQPPLHPGEFLREEFLKPLKITPYRLAKDLNVPPQRIGDIVNGKRRITAETALRLSRYFGTSDHYWLNLQNCYDIESIKDRFADRLAEEIMPLSKAS